MESGAIFQSLVQSLLKLILAATVLASSFHILTELVLMTLSVTALNGEILQIPAVMVSG